VDVETRAIHSAREALGRKCLRLDGLCHLDEIAAEIEKSQELLGSMRLTESERGPQTIVSRLAEIQFDRGEIGREASLALRIRRRRIENEIAYAHRRGAAGSAVLEELERLDQELRALDSPETSPLDGISFAGAGLVALLDEAKPEDVYPGIPPAGHFSLLVAPSFSGKTSLVLWNAMALASGVSPWAGAPARPPGRTLFYSIDEPPTQVAQRIQSLAKSHPGGRCLADFAERLEVVGPHRTVLPDALASLRFTEEGIRTLERILKEAEAAGDPFSVVIVDAYSDLLPIGESDTSNEEATRIGGHLERLAVHHGCAIQVIHHAGKPKAGGEIPDPRDLGRGASALAAKARAIFTLEEEAGMSQVRKIRTRTNLGPSPGPLLLEVTSDGDRDSKRIDFFRPHDPATAYPINEYFRPEDRWISKSELARRLSDLKPGSKPSGGAVRIASKRMSIWQGAGLVEIRSGPKNATEMRRISSSAPSAPQCAHPPPYRGDGQGALRG
jgi:hypothetical protein